MDHISDGAQFYDEDAGGVIHVRLSKVWAFDRYARFQNGGHVAQGTGRKVVRLRKWLQGFP